MPKIKETRDLTESSLASYPGREIPCRKLGDRLGVWNNHGFSFHLGSSWWNTTILSHHGLGACNSIPWGVSSQFVLGLLTAVFLFIGSVWNEENKVLMTDILFVICIDILSSLGRQWFRCYWSTRRSELRLCVLNNLVHSQHLEVSISLLSYVLRACFQGID